MRFYCWSMFVETEDYFKNTAYTHWSAVTTSISLSRVGVNNYNRYLIHEERKETTNLSTEEEQLIDLQNNIFYQSIFAQSSKDEFSLSSKESYPMVRSKAIKIILPIAPSWHCECKYSARAENRNKKRANPINLATGEEMLRKTRLV